MSDLLWPGDGRAGDLMSDAAVLRALVRVEGAWLAALVDLGVAPASAAADLHGLVSADDIEEVSAAAEAGGNPVIALVGLLRARLGAGRPDAAHWVHRGLTSQDVLDTALQLTLRDVLERVERELRAQAGSLAGLADRHRASVMTGRTLTQAACPTTFGLKAAGWLQGLLDAGEDLARAADGLAGQFGGAVGTLAATTLLAEQSGHTDPARVALDLAAQASRSVGLQSRPPWHTTRSPVTRAADALVAYADAAGHVAHDVLTLSRPEIGELAEPADAGRGGSSTMPHKANPVLSVLIRRAALTAPAAAAQLHLAAAETLDERPDGGWHTEWATLRSLARRTVVAASQASELLAGLRVDTERMRSTADRMADDLLAERRSLVAGDARPGDARPDSYLGATSLLIDEILDRSATFLKESK